MTIIGVKSNIPTLGITLLRGLSKGSVIWYMMVMKGLLEWPGDTQEIITLANIANWRKVKNSRSNPTIDSATTNLLD